MSEVETARTFYTRSPGMVIQMLPPKIVEVDGKFKTTGEKFLRFSPLGKEKFGYLRTADPAEIEYLSNCPDVFDERKFNEISVPADIRAASAEAEKGRLIEENNRLLAQLAKLKQAPPTQAPATPQQQRN